MDKTKEKLKRLEKSIKRQWQSIESTQDLTTKEKLEKLVAINLKRNKREPQVKSPSFSSVNPEKPFLVYDYSYSLDDSFSSIKLSDWLGVSAEELAIIAGDEDFFRISPQNLLFFDSETTGLAGGTGTIPFMLGFGFLSGDQFAVKIFLLNDLSGEEEFLEAVYQFIKEGDFSATVTYNGKSFDFPLMETRYILYRRQFPLLAKPHLDFLFPARILWKHSHETRKLSYLGECLLGLSRDEDIDGSQIPAIYFSYLRNQSFSLVEKILQHNALDIVGLAGLLLLALRYIKDSSLTRDEGEFLGLATLYERSGCLEQAIGLYNQLQAQAQRDDIRRISIRRLALMKKREKLFGQAAELWQILSKKLDPQATKELSIHYEHRHKNYLQALEEVERLLELAHLTDSQRRDFEKRWQRLQKKIAGLPKDE